MADAGETGTGSTPSPTVIRPAHVQHHQKQVLVVVILGVGFIVLLMDAVGHLYMEDVVETVIVM